MWNTVLSGNSFVSWAWQGFKKEWALSHPYLWMTRFHTHSWYCHQLPVPTCQESVWCRSSVLLPSQTVWKVLLALNQQQKKQKLNDVDKKMFCGNQTTCSRHTAVLLHPQRWPLPSALYWAVSLLCVLSIPAPPRGRCGTQDVGHTAFRPIFCLIYKVFSPVALRRGDTPALL